MPYIGQVEDLYGFPYSFAARTPNHDSFEIEQVLDYGDHGHTFGDWTFRMILDAGDWANDPISATFNLFFKSPTDLLFARMVLENA